MKTTLERPSAIPILVLVLSFNGFHASAQTLPPFRQLPSDAPSRLAQAVSDQLHAFAGDNALGGDALGGDRLAAVSPSALDQPNLRRSLWDSIEGAMGTAPRAGLGPTPLLEVLDSAIGAYMTELGRIAHEIDRRGGGDTVATLAPLHPGEQGSGAIAVGTVGPFHQLAVNFRGEIHHPDGRSPAVVAIFYLKSNVATSPPIPGRLLIPTTGAQPSFRAEVDSGTGERETRDYGWRPRLARTSSILELMIDGRWTRVEDDTDAMPQRRAKREPLGFCDATCTGP